MPIYFNMKMMAVDIFDFFPSKPLYYSITKAATLYQANQANILQVDDITWLERNARIIKRLK